MGLAAFIRTIPKVELHVHLEGSIEPATLLELARRNRVELPATSEAELREWYVFRDFPHFVEVYIAISRCICTTEDLELIGRAFLAGQAAQQIIYSEVTFTAQTHQRHYGLPFREQIAALNRARRWAEAELGVSMGLIIDIARDVAPEAGLEVADWVIDAYGDGVVALGLGGSEAGHPPEKHAAAFARARAAGVPLVLHAGETAGAASIRGALAQGSVRLGHGVRCLEDPQLVAELRERQVPLEVCPTSNVCLGVVPSFAEHPLPELLAHGLYVTLNSDDPPMFNTTLTDEYLRAAATFGFDRAIVEQLVCNAARAALLPADRRTALIQRIQAAIDAAPIDRE
ncbi:MAG TPA: adenosine deaminase [Roseiflexaceae bacterium]|nr:adenosine deaminase [Roseiflexaceae bacterium]HMP42461.1 adenosine deaminase [Roseiflexaceae bacterium]